MKDIFNLGNDYFEEITKIVSDRVDEKYFKVDDRTKEKALKILKEVYFFTRKMSNDKHSIYGMFEIMDLMKKTGEYRFLDLPLYFVGEQAIDGLDGLDFAAAVLVYYYYHYEYNQGYMVIGENPEMLFKYANTCIDNKEVYDKILNSETFENGLDELDFEVSTYFESDEEEFYEDMKEVYGEKRADEYEKKASSWDCEGYVFSEFDKNEKYEMIKGYINNQPCIEVYTKQQFEEYYKELDSRTVYDTELERLYDFANTGESVKCIEGEWMISDYLLHHLSEDVDDEGIEVKVIKPLSDDTNKYLFARIVIL